ncbi:uncharacterized protein I303_106645 [Kwoniella dejecticola CBS 10117]|uniref:Uncharacterized protein n=1 Tax=Kwoniella dejecticola CBS 10117 TaxID=1296121 RepID=A0A1A5ZU57_9TREE|nr:uncharacterized protein I303_08712 [Kwoniella dejecticola CBS 10117]OBR81325.1 hypothetical protein I303_08712 [Kwoniella dejecticola CBS 10117]
MTIPTSPTFCRGYILAHQHPSSAGNQVDPYAVIPCPHDAQVPQVVSDRCKDSTGARACWRAKYCEMHWCGGCKKVNKIGRTAVEAKAVGVNNV